MSLSNKIFVITLMSLLALVSCKEEAIALTNIEKNIVEPNPAQLAVLTQLNVSTSNWGGPIYTYKCTVGTFRSNRLACTSRDSTSWPSVRDVHLRLRCPNSGYGYTVSYVEFIFSVSSPSVNCYVNEGAVGLNYIAVTVDAWNTRLFRFSANFYTF